MVSSRLILVSLFILLVNTTWVSAQFLKFGKYSNEELLLEAVDYEPDARGVVLGESSNITFARGVVHQNIHRRIKVLKDNGKDLGNVKIQYFVGENNVERIAKLSAQIHTSNGENPKVIVLDKSDFYETDEGNGFKAIKFTFPEVGVGSILEYDYTLISYANTFLDPWIFQSNIPTLQSFYQIDVPVYFDYKVIQFGPQTSKYDYRGKNRQGIYSWNLKNLSSIKDEPMMGSIIDHVERVEFQIAGAGWSYRPDKKFLTWQELTDFYKGTTLVDGYIKPSKTVLADLHYPKVEGTQLDKAKAIYDAIRLSFDYSGLAGYYPSQPLKDLLMTQKGARQDINMLLYSLLHKENIEAYPMMLSDKKNGRENLILSPFLGQFNQMIVMVRIEGKTYYLDATNKYAPFGYIDPTLHAAMGYLLRDKDSGIVHVDLAHRSGITQIVTIEANEEMLFQSKSIIRFSDYDGLLTDESKGEDSDDDFIKKYFSKIHNQITDFSYKVKNEGRKQVDVNLTRNFGRLDSDLLVLHPFEYVRFEKNPLVSNERAFPVKFPYAFNDNYSVMIKIPQGYELDDYPMDAELILPGGESIFRYSVTALDGMVKVSATTDLRQHQISPEIYPSFKSFMELWTSKLQEPIVLKKSDKQVALEN